MRARFQSLRRTLLGAALAMPAWRAARAGVIDEPITFPRDEGAHPATRIEWWYATGWLGPTPDAPQVGFQITFFRARRAASTQTPSASRFANPQVLFAHAAIADPQVGHLEHDQNIARPGFGYANASEDDLSLKLGSWRLERLQGSRYHAQVDSARFAFDLTLDATQTPMLQGNNGRSQKGPEPAQFSRYYSLPQLAVTGSRTSAGRRQTVAGRAWFDHEWSDRMLPDTAAGWDWVGLNLDDGSSLMAFQVRGRDGGVVWADAGSRERDGPVRAIDRRSIRFDPVRRWTSPRTGTSYPVSQRLLLGDREWLLRPLMDDQELDSSASTGVVYWEGAVVVEERGRVIGRGYLELTGYSGTFPAFR